MLRLLITTALACFFMLPMLAKAAYVVIVNNTTASSINVDEIRRYYLNESRYFPDGKRVTVLKYDSNDIMDNAFNAAILGLTSRQLRAHWAKMIFTGKGRPPLKIESQLQLRDRVAKQPGAIGYIEEKYLDGNVKEIYRFPEIPATQP